MESLYLLIPLSVVLVFVIGVLFWWSLRSGQYDDLEGPAYRLLMDDRDPLPGESPQEVAASPSAEAGTDAPDRGSGARRGESRFRSTEVNLCSTRGRKITPLQSIARHDGARDSQFMSLCWGWGCVKTHPFFSPVSSPAETAGTLAGAGFQRVLAMSDRGCGEVSGLFLD